MIKAIDIKSIELDYAIFNKPKIVIYNKAGRAMKILYPARGKEITVLTQVNAAFLKEIRRSNIE